MAGTHLSIRIDLPSGNRIGPGKIALLEAIQSTGSISAAARSIGMSYRRAWLLVDEINQTLREPAVTAEIAGARGGRQRISRDGQTHAPRRQRRRLAHDPEKACAGLDAGWQPASGTDHA